MWIKWDTQWCVLEMLCFLNCFLYVMYVNVLWPSGPPHFGLFGQSNLNKSSLRLGNCEEHFLQFLTFCRLNHYRPMIKKTLFRSGPDQQLPQISLDTVETVFQCNSCHLLSEIWSGCILLPLCSGWYWIFKCRQCQSQIRSHLYSLNDLGVSTITSQRECPGWLEWNLQSILVFSCFFFFFFFLSTPRHACEVLENMPDSELESVPEHCTVAAVAPKQLEKRGCIYLKGLMTMNWNRKRAIF